MLFPRHFLDVSPALLATAARACVRPPDAAQLQRRIERGLAPDALVCLSLRSGFDLLLETLELPAGSEVLFSAVTHPDMAAIAELHGLTPVPVDLDPETLAPQPQLLERAASPRTRMLVVAHLFGGSVDVGPFADFAARHELVLVEDCAQSFRGPGESGDPRSDAALFSFGTIKTATALGGAVCYVRSPALRARMRTIESTWPRQAVASYLGRVLRVAGLLGLGEPHVYGAFTRLGSLAGLDLDALVNRPARRLRAPSTGDAAAFRAWLRRRPSAPLLALLGRRLATFDPGRLERRRALGERVAAALPSELFHPGRMAERRTHWVFPVATPAPQRLIHALRQAGFDATAATSSIAAVDAPAERPECEPVAARRLMSQVVFLPVYPELPPAAVQRLLTVLERAAG